MTQHEPEAFLLRLQDYLIYGICLFGYGAVAALRPEVFLPVSLMAVGLAVLATGLLRLLVPEAVISYITRSSRALHGWPLLGGLVRGSEDMWLRPHIVRMGGILWVVGGVLVFGLGLLGAFQGMATTPPPPTQP